MKKKNHKTKRAAESGIKICILTKKPYPREEMLRYVRSPNDTIVFDVTETLPGAGSWLYPSFENIQTAIKRRTFHKAAGGGIFNETDIYAETVTALKKRCLNLLGLARKAGYVVYGYENVKKSLEKQEVFLAFEADDASTGGQSKLYRPSDDFLICNALSREELGQVTGQEAQVHVVVLKSKIAEELKRNALKLNLLAIKKEG